MHINIAVRLCFICLSPKAVSEREEKRKRRSRVCAFERQMLHKALYVQRQCFGRIVFVFPSQSLQTLNNFLRYPFGSNMCPSNRVGSRDSDQSQISHISVAIRSEMVRGCHPFSRYRLSFCEQHTLVWAVFGKVSKPTGNFSAGACVLDQIGIYEHELGGWERGLRFNEVCWTRWFDKIQPL